MAVEIKLPTLEAGGKKQSLVEVKKRIEAQHAKGKLTAKRADRSTGGY